MRTRLLHKLFTATCSLLLNRHVLIAMISCRLNIVKDDFERKLEDHSKRLFGAASTARKLGEGNPWVIKRLFHDFDPDNSNAVDIAEFTNLVREHFALKFSDKDIQSLFDHYDIDNSGKIEVDEFIQIFSKMNLQSFKKEDGIIDVPSTQVCSENKFKSHRELEYELQNEIHTKLWKSGLGLKSVFGRACLSARDPRDKENMKTLEGTDVMKYKIISTGCRLVHRYQTGSASASPGSLGTAMRAGSPFYPPAPL